MNYHESIDFTKDSHFRVMETSGLKYFPWIGKDFFLCQEKILIVGESVYNWGKDEKEKNTAREMLEKSTFARFVAFNHGLTSTNPKHKFTRNLEKAIAGKHFKTNQERINFWRSVSFHEFVQRPMINRKERPSKEDYKHAAKILIELINELQITKCIFSGTDWNKFIEIEQVIKSKSSKHFNEKLNGSRPKVIHIKNEINSKIYFIKHPSSYFTWEKWNQFINTY